ncbi:MAG: hypothetical protein HKN17_04380 [Rhodothermales bacterium]|nr:hypothetical protein [Rhodothermales bacterium]
MKSRYAFISLLSCAVLLLFSPANADAQSASQDITALTATPGVNNMPAEKGQIYVGVGLAFNTHVEDPGIGAGFWYQVTPMIAAGVQGNYWLIESIDGVSQSIISFDFLGSYPLMEMENGMVLSAIAGLNFLRWSYKIDNCDGGGFLGDLCDQSASDVGLDAGGMIVYPLGSVSIFVQVFVVGLGGDSSGGQFGGGVAFGL